GNERLPSPSLTYTKTLASLPSFATTVSALLSPLQAGSLLMSIGTISGAVPSKCTSRSPKPRLPDQSEQPEAPRALPHAMARCSFADCTLSIHRSQEEER